MKSVVLISFFFLTIFAAELQFYFVLIYDKKLLYCIAYTKKVDYDKVHKKNLKIEKA